MSWLFQTQVEVALAAADGNLNVAVEILMSQQVLVHHSFFIYNSSRLRVYLFSLKNSWACLQSWKENFCWILVETSLTLLVEYVAALCSITVCLIFGTYLPLTVRSHHITMLTPIKQNWTYVNYTSNIKEYDV